MSGVSPDDLLKFIDEEVTKLDVLCAASPSETPQIPREQKPINDLLKLRLVLKKLRNSYAPIFRIPNEILVEIFTIADHADKIAQICLPWRLLAVSTPALWTHPPTHHHNHMLRFLKRSKRAPIDIYISRYTAFATASVLLKNIGRIRQLHVDQSLTYMSNMLMPVTQRRHAPLLEDLSIECWCGDGLQTFLFSVEAFGVTAKLRKLKLNNLCFDWCILLNLPALTHLSLHDVTVTHDVTGEEFTNTLWEMPLLQDLSMSFGDIQLNKYSPTTPFEPIHFPHLTGLDIRPGSQQRHVHHFLANATLPQLCSLHLDYGDDRVDYSPMVRTLASAIQKANFSRLECLTIGSGMIRIQSKSLIPRGSSYIQVFLPVTQEDFYTDHYDMAINILSCITPIGSNEFSPLVRLAIGSLELDSDELQELFGELPNLEHVEFSWELDDSFIEALSIPLNHSADSPILFSSLKSIEWHGRFMHDSQYPDPESLGEFIDCLMQRCEYGAPIQELVLRCCNLDANPVEARLLKEIVVKVSVSSSLW